MNTGKKLRSVISCLLAAAMIFSCTAIAVGQASANSKFNKLGQLPLVKEPVKLTMMLGYYSFLVSDLKEHYALNEIQKVTGIDLEIELIDYQQVAEKVTLMLSSNEKLPDILTATRISTAQISSYGSKGVFAPLNDMIKNDSYWIAQRLAEYPELEKQMEAWDGNIYMIPRYTENLMNAYGGKIWINQTWLDNLDLEMPTTTQEFYEVLKAFKEQDANGNGDLNDEIPLTSSKNHAGNTVGGPLMNPWVYDDGGNQLIMEEGAVVPAYDKDEWREGLKYLNKLYNEGLLDSECYTQDTNMLKQLFINQTVTAGAMFVTKPTNIIPAANPEIWSQYVIMPPLEGEARTPVTIYTPPVIRSDCASLISAKSNYKEEAFRLIDYLWSEESRFITCFGEENVDWKWPEKGVLGVNNEPAFFEIINGFGSPEMANRIVGDNFTYFEPEKFTAGQIKKEGDADQVFYEDIMEKLYGFENEDIVPPLMTINPDHAEEHAELRTAINEYVNEMKAKFVVGSEIDVNDDDDWNRYLKELESFGLTRYMEIVNDSYAHYIK